MVYIALNMRRCGVVGHPREWPWCGYHELIGARRRYRVLDMDCVLQLFGDGSTVEFRDQYEAMIEKRIAKDLAKREPEWTESIAVGSEEFVRKVAQFIQGRQNWSSNPKASIGACAKCLRHTAAPTSQARREPKGLESKTEYKNRR